MISLSHTFDVAMCTVQWRRVYIGNSLGSRGYMGLMGMGIAKLVLWE